MAFQSRGVQANVKTFKDVLHIVDKRRRRDREEADKKLGRYNRYGDNGHDSAINNQLGLDLMVCACLPACLPACLRGWR